MSTQRPFLSNFLAAFRARSAFQTGKATSSVSAAASSQQAQHQHGTSQPSQPRSITTSSKHPAGGTSAALTNLHSPRNHAASPLSTSPGTSPADTLPIYGPHTQTQAQNAAKYLGSTRGRRGSDSSSEGFRDVIGAEKWYIGGRTAGGEEKYFKLGVIKRQRSVDRLSLDRLSL